MRRGISPHGTAAGRKLAEKRIAKASFPDVLSSDGTDIFMRQMRWDKQGVIRPENVPHLFSSAGFLDSTPQAGPVWAPTREAAARPLRQGAGLSRLAQRGRGP